MEKIRRLEAIARTATGVEIVKKRIYSRPRMSSGLDMTVLEHKGSCGLLG